MTTTRSDTTRRERILDAAVKELSEKGYAGARTASIAKRAGVNPQLITYYFGGKKGLLDALRERWSAKAAEEIPDGTGFVEAALGYAEIALDQPDWSRLLAWQALEGRPAPGPAGDAQVARIRESVARTAERQRKGELREDLDPAMIVLLAHCLALAPVLLPTVVGAVTSDSAPWTDYRELLAEQLPLLLERAR